ncbi:phage DNA packaging protein J [Streptomyces sp. NPDC047108]|uniref:phage DNA packaging protein J n=1 Tax=Streptomyces sp. NPDC047108 TaxID=3155025 RepID=UPI003404BD09
MAAFNTRRGAGPSPGTGRTSPDLLEQPYACDLCFPQPIRGAPGRSKGSRGWYGTVVRGAAPHDAYRTRSYD